MIGPSPTRVLLAVMAEHHEHGRATVRSVAARAELAIGTTHRHLRRLRAEGLVTWEQGRDATLRPLVAHA